MNPQSGNAAHAVRLHVLNTSVQQATNARNEATASRWLLGVILAINVPQITVAMVLMVLHWHDVTLEICDRVRVWVVFHTLYLLVTSILEYLVYCLNRPNLSYQWSLWREQNMAFVLKVREVVNLLGLFWFVMGNLWILNNADHDENDPESCRQCGVLYQVAVWMLLIRYLRLFLPCIMVLLLLPIVCLCLPCVLRLLRRFQDPERPRGMADDALSQLPVEVFSPSTFQNDPSDANCCICLNAYEQGETLRFLPCHHHFHQACVDAWLHVNASCPTCRQSIASSVLIV